MKRVLKVGVIVALVGYCSFAAFNPETRTAVVLLSNYGDAFAHDHSLNRVGMKS